MPEYHIRYVEEDPGSCCVCQVSGLGWGPVGWRAAEDGSPGGPVCDLCLMDHAVQLGHVLLNTHMIRDLAGCDIRIAAEREEDRVKALYVCAHAWGYDASIANWPKRTVRLCLDRVVSAITRILSWRQLGFGSDTTN